MTTRRRVPCLLVTLLALVGGCADAADTGHPAPNTRVRLHVANVPVDVRIASRFSERRRGLGGVDALGPNEGMLFVYNDATSRRFHMQDCLIPLDIAFLDDKGIVVQLDTLAPPAQVNGAVKETRRSPPVRYVLEVQAGFFARHGLGEGSRVRLPASVDPALADE